MSIKLNIEMSARDLAYELSESEIADIAFAKMGYDKVAKWVVDNFDMADILNHYGEKTLNHFTEDELLGQCSEEAIKNKYFENSPLNKLL